MTTVGERIVGARKAAGLSRPALAKASGIPYPTLAGLENGDQKSSTVLPAIAAACGVSALWLATGRGPMAPGAESQPVRADRQRMADAMKLLELLGELQDCPELVRDSEAVCIAYDFLEYMDMQESNVIDITRQLAAKLKDKPEDGPEK